MPPSSAGEAAFRLEGAPKASLIRAMALFGGMLTNAERDNLRMGGGTALAMRWNHRTSTDVDLAVDAPFYQSFLARERRRLQAAVKGMKAAGEIKTYRLTSTFVGWVSVESGPISLSGSLVEPPCAEREADTCVRLAPTREILAGKLLGRVLQRDERRLARDGYDLCCAFRHDLDAMLSVLQEAEVDLPGRLEALLTEIESSPKRIMVGRPLLNTIYPDIAHDPWRRFAELARAALPELSQSLPSPGT